MCICAPLSLARIVFGNFTAILLLLHPLSLIKLKIEAKICLDLRLWMGPFFIGHCSRTQILAQKCFFVLHMAEMFFNHDHGNGLKMEIFTFPFSILYTQKTFLSETEFKARIYAWYILSYIHQEVLIGGQYFLCVTLRYQTYKQPN